MEEAKTKNANKFSNAKVEREYSDDGSFVEKEFDEDGRLRRTTPHDKNGKREGLEKLYNKDGTVKEEIPYKRDKKNGVARYFCSDGRRIDTPYIDDVIHGLRRYNNPNNYFYVTTMPYNNNRLEGLELSHGRGGETWHGRAFKNGELVGTGWFGVIAYHGINITEKALHYSGKAMNRTLKAIDLVIDRFIELSR